MNYRELYRKICQSRTKIKMNLQDKESKVLDENHLYFNELNSIDKNYKLLLDYNYFQCSKLTFLINEMKSHTKNTLLSRYKAYLLEIINENLEVYSKNKILMSNEYMIDKLRSYINDKFKFDKSKHYINPKFYPVSSKLQIYNLKKAVESNQLDYKGVSKISKSLGVSYYTLYQNIKNRLSLNFKQNDCLNEKRNTETNKMISELFLLKKASCMNDDLFYIYIDESSFNSHKRKRKRWVFKASSNNFYDYGRIKSSTLILASSKFKILNFTVSKKTINADKFIKFIKILKVKIFESNYLSDLYFNKKICLVMDNACIHSAKNVKSHLDKSDFKVLFLPPYHPEINFVEYLFRLLKQQFYRRSFKNQ